MHRFSGRIVLTAAAVAGLAMAGPLSVAFGSANDKGPEYDADGAASSHFAVGLPHGPALLGGHSDASSHTSDEGAASRSSARSLAVPGHPVGSSASCEAVGAEDQGAVKDTHDAAVLAPKVGPVEVRVLSASCDARAVKSNNAASSARASVVEASVADLDVAVLSNSSDVKTTSGSSHADSSFAVVAVGDTNVVGCSASSRDSNGSGADSAGAVLLGIQVTGTPCPLVTSGTDYQRTGPNA